MKKLFFLIIFVSCFSYIFANDESDREKTRTSGGDIRHKEKLLSADVMDCSYDGQMLYLYSAQSFEDVYIVVSSHSGSVIVEQSLEMTAHIPYAINVESTESIKVIIYLPNGKIYSKFF